MKRSVLVGLVLLVTISCTGGSSDSPNPGAPSPTPSPSPAPAPSTFALSGRVTESAPTTANAIGGATVTIVDGPNGGKSTATDGSGNYSFSGLTAGGFTVRATAGGYQESSQGVTLTANRSANFGLRPNPQTLDNQLEDDVNGGSTVCPDFFTTSRQPCKAYPIPAHNGGRLTAVLTWTGGSSFFPTNDLDLALLKDPRANPEDRVVISRSATSYQEEISADLTAGVMYYVHVLYNSGSTSQHFTLRITRPN